MGRVYLGESPSGQLVAVKLIRLELADDPDFRRRFAHEVRAARCVGGSFTAPVVDADPDGPQPWLVTAYVDGPSVTEAVTAQGPMPVDAVRTLAAGLAEGLGAVHAAGLVHRDLKPSNVLLASDGPRIIDFGICRAVDAAALTNASGVVGSPGFMSPEQAEGHPVGPPADVFSLGGVLAFAATGEPPFGAGSATALLYRVVYGTAATGHVPAELKSLVERCLAKDPADRPTTRELRAELGFAAPPDGWRSWHGAVILRRGDMPATQVDDRRHELHDGNGAAGLRPGPDPSASRPESRHGSQPAAGRTPRPASSRVRHARRPRQPGRHAAASRIGVAVAAILAFSTAAVVAFAVLTHRPHSTRAGSAGPLAQQVHARPAAQRPGALRPDAQAP